MRYTALLCLALLLACRQPIEVRPGYDTTQARRRALEENIGWFADTIPLLKFKPPFSYYMVKAQVESCLGKKKDGFPTFYLAPIQPIAQDGSMAGYIHRSVSVVFGLGAETELWIVAHELAHWIDAPQDHPEEIFNAQIGKCGRVVNPPRGY